MGDVLSFPSCGSSNTATQSQVRDCTIYIDWLTLAQVHDSAPIVGSTLLIFADVATGEFQAQTVRGLQVEGSYSSSLQVRCDGRRVEVSGNPSRFGRPDNVFGMTSMDDAIALYNTVLRSVGLPEFFDDDRTHLQQLQGWRNGSRRPTRYVYEDAQDLQRSIARSDRKGGQTNVMEHGCRIKRIDLCRVYEVGNLDDAIRSIRALSSTTYNGKAAFVYPDGCTAAFGQGSRYAYFKYYVKGPEMRKHLDQNDEYAKALTEWACDSGIIRHEVSLKAMNLSRNGLDRPAAWTHQQAAEIMNSYQTHESAGLSTSSYDKIAEELEAKGVPTSRARRAQQAAYAYLAGHNFIVGHNISRASYFRLKADLKKAGLDIGAPLNVSALRHSVRVVEWKPAAPPAFYRRLGS